MPLRVGVSAHQFKGADVALFVCGPSGQISGVNVKVDAFSPLQDGGFPPPAEAADAADACGAVGVVVVAEGVVCFSWDFFPSADAVATRLNFSLALDDFNGFANGVG